MKNEKIIFKISVLKKKSVIGVDINATVKSFNVLIPAFLVYLVPSAMSIAKSGIDILPIILKLIKLFRKPKWSINIVINAIVFVIKNIFMMQHIICDKNNLKK